MTRKILQGKDASITELEEIVLDDIREAGVFGGRTKERRKSSNVIVQTYYEQDGKSTSKFKVMLNTMFPSAENLSDRYVNAKKYKILLPVAWSQRVLFHFKEKSKNKNEPDLFKKASLVEERLRLLEKLDLKN